jgi:hypothetical protein
MYLRTIAAAVLCVLATGPMAFGQGKGRGGNSAIAAQNGWIFSLAEGKRQAAQSGKPLMVVIRCEP